MKKWYGTFAFVFIICRVEAQVPKQALGVWKLAYCIDENGQKWNDGRSSSTIEIDTSAQVLWTNILHQEIYLQDKNGETAVRSQVDTMHYNGQWVKEEAKTLIRLTLHDKRVEVYQLIKIKDHQIIVWNSKNNLTYCFVK